MTAARYVLKIEAADLQEAALRLSGIGVRAGEMGDRLQRLSTSLDEHQWSGNLRDAVTAEKSDQLHECHGGDRERVVTPLAFPGRHQRVQPRCVTLG